MIDKLLKQKQLAAHTLVSKFEAELPEVCTLARSCGKADIFKKRLTEQLRHLATEQSSKNCLLRLIEFDGKVIHELSTGDILTLDTISSLWEFLNGQQDNQGISVDCITDIFMQFKRLYSFPAIKPDANKVLSWMHRWPGGLNENVLEIRKANKDRIISHLIERIQLRNSNPSRFEFPEGLDDEGKRRLVEIWWNDFRFHLEFASRSLQEINKMLGYSLNGETIEIYKDARRKGIPIFVTPYYLSLLNTSDKGYDDSAIRSYILYSRELVDTFGSIRAWEKEDIVNEGEPNAAGWMLPEGHNVHRRYPEVAILIPDTAGRSCGGLCASCQRMYDFQSGHLNFRLDELKPNETWDKKLHRLMNYFKDDPQIRDILITGGDALMSRNKSLRNILEAVYSMAKRKRKENEGRPEGQKYAELQRVRLGSRLPAYLPMRIDDELVDILRQFKAKASGIGVRQFFIQTHFQTPLEVTPESREAVRRLQSAGWTVTNQLVFNVAASRRGHTAKLRQALNKIGVLCYYSFSVKGFQENHAVFTPNSRSIQEQQEEKIIGEIDKQRGERLMQLIEEKGNDATAVNAYLTETGLPFAATDRNVLNLPGIGKSMTFSLVGIMQDGCRILAFDHDTTRRHSPVIEDMPIVYIKENKSILEYLKGLAAMGENPSEYDSVWDYTEGRTEPRFRLYEYPSQRAACTQNYSNIAQS